MDLEGGQGRQQPGRAAAVPVESTAPYVAGFVLAALLMVAVALYLLWQGRESARQEAAAEAANLTRLLERYVFSAIDESDLALQMAAEEYRHELQHDAGLARFGPFLDALHQRLPQVMQLRATDPQGRVEFGRGLDPAQPVTLGDRRYFALARDGMAPALSAPRLTRNDRQWALPVARRIDTVDGKFAGIVYADIAVDYFGRLFASLDAGRHATFLLFGDEADIYVRYPEPKGPGSAIGLQIGSPQFRALWTQGIRSATYRAQSTTDGVWRTYSFRRVGNYPLYIMAGLAEQDYLAPWKRQVAVTAGFLTAFALLVTLLLRSLARSVNSRRAAYLMLADSRQHLEALVEQRSAALSETEARASVILESAADGIYGVDAEGRLSFINPAACAMLGYRAEAVIGRDAHALFHGRRADGTPYPSAECPAHGALHRGQSVRVDNEVYWHADGHAIPVMYATLPMVQNGRVTGTVTSFVDVSVQRVAAEAREQALLAAENLARARREFLANMSHELRTPLTAVLGFAQIGARQVEAGSKARAAFAKIEEAGNRLLRMVNDVLEFSRIENGKLVVNYSEVMPAELARQVVDAYRGRAQAKGIALDLRLADDLPQRWRSDPKRIVQVLGNLLDNAVKFTGQGRIDVAVSCTDGELRYRVSDSGIGMSAAEIELLFQPFRQIDGSSSRRFGGSGLGLALGKRIAELMGGGIEVASEPGRGSRFTLRLPYVAITVPEDAAGA